MPAAGFDDKLLARLSKLDSEQQREFVSRLLAQKQFLQGVFDELAEGVIVADHALRIQFMNRRARQMLAWPRGRDYAGEDLLDLLDPAHPLRPTMEALRLRPRPIDGVECPFGRKGERTLSLSAVLMPLEQTPEPSAGEENAPPILLLLSDVTERRRRMSEQARARRLASLATLTSGIAHEIKNPLNSLNIHAQLMQEEVESARGEGRAINPAKAERAMSVILEETGRLARIIEEFLQAARPRSPRLELSSLDGLLEQAERIFRPECEHAGIDFSLARDPDLPPLFFDEHLLMQALRNLVRNSIEAVAERHEKAAAEGEEYLPWVRLGAELAGDHVNLRVADNGPGIPEGALEHIFEPYYTSKFGGTGLGLMVVYRIVTEHRGTLHVDTRPGEGTQFVISLPLHQRPVRLLEENAAAQPKGLLAEAPENQPPARKN